MSTPFYFQGFSYLISLAKEVKGYVFNRKGRGGGKSANRRVDGFEVQAPGNGGDELVESSLFEGASSSDLNDSGRLGLENMSVVSNQIGEFYDATEAKVLFMVHLLLPLLIKGGFQDLISFKVFYNKSLLHCFCVDILPCIQCACYRWQHEDLPILQVEDQTRNTSHENVVVAKNKKKKKKKSSNGSPVLAPFQLAGPMELWIQDTNNMKLSLPLDILQEEHDIVIDKASLGGSKRIKPTLYGRRVKLYNLEKETQFDILTVESSIP